MRMSVNASDILQQATDLYGERLYWHIRRLVVNHDDAEDALQVNYHYAVEKIKAYLKENAI